MGSVNFVMVMMRACFSMSEAVYGAMQAGSSPNAPEDKEGEFIEISSTNIIKTGVSMALLAPRKHPDDARYMIILDMTSGEKVYTCHEFDDAETARDCRDAMNRIIGAMSNEKTKAT